MLKKIRIQNFKCLQDTEDMEIRPITFLVGPNSSGKSSVFQAILALKQTVESGDQKSPLILKDYIDLGSYKDVFFKHDTDKDIKIDFGNTDSLKWSITFSVQEDGKTPGKIVVKSFEFSGKEFAPVAEYWSGPPHLPDKLKLIKGQKDLHIIYNNTAQKINDKLLIAFEWHFSNADRCISKLTIKRLDLESALDIM